MAQEKPCIFCESRTEGIIFGIQKPYVCSDCIKKIEQVCIENLIQVFIKQGAYTDPKIIAEILLDYAEFITGESATHLLELQKKNFKRRVETFLSYFSLYSFNERFYI